MQTAFVISAGEQPKRLDIFLVHREPKLSRAALQRMITAGWVRVNGHIAKSSQRIKAGDMIAIDAPQAMPLKIDGETRPLEILFEDHACLVLNKPAGIVVHPSPGHWSNTLLNALLNYCAHSGEAVTPGVVHRLDKDTSGVMVVAKTEEAHRKLSVQFERHSMTRHYEALVAGVPVQSEGRIDAALGPDRNNPKRTSTRTAHPKPAVTDYRVEEAFGKRRHASCSVLTRAVRTRYGHIFTQSAIRSWATEPMGASESVRSRGKSFTGSCCMRVRWGLRIPSQKPTASFRPPRHQISTRSTRRFVWRRHAFLEFLGYPVAIGILRAGTRADGAQVRMSSEEAS